MTPTSLPGAAGCRDRDEVEPLGRQLALLGEQRADIERLAASRRLQPAAYALGTRNQLGDALALTDVETSGQPSLLASKSSTLDPCSRSSSMSRALA